MKKRLTALAREIPAPEVGIVRRESLPTRDEIESREIRRRSWIESKRSVTKRDLTGRANGTIDPFYGCFLTDELEDYALNFSVPWSESIDSLDVSMSFFLTRLFITREGLSSEVVIEDLDDFGPFNVRYCNRIAFLVYYAHCCLALQCSRCSCASRSS